MKNKQITIETLTPTQIITRFEFTQEGTQVVFYPVHGMAGWDILLVALTCVALTCVALN